MKKSKQIPEIPLENDGSVSDVIQDFINTMVKVTGNAVDVNIDAHGNVTIYFEAYEHPPIIHKRPEIDMDILYRGDYMNNLIK
jgi:hypothetical protein